MRSPPPTVHPYHSDPPLPPQRGADVLHSSNSGHRVGPVRSNPWATFSGDIRSSCATAAGSRSGTWLWPTSWSSCRSSSWPLSVSGVAGGVLDGGDGGRRRERLMTAVRGGPQGRQSTGAAGEDDMEGGEAMRWTMQRTKRSVIESDSLWWLSANTRFAWAGGTCPRFAWAGRIFSPVILILGFQVPPISFISQVTRSKRILKKILGFHIPPIFFISHLSPWVTTQAQQCLAVAVALLIVIVRLCLSSSPRLKRN